MANAAEATQWLDPVWRAHAREWICEKLSERGKNLSGEITQPHIRPWATALHVPTDRGVGWFKATDPVLGHESAVTALLSDQAPGWTPRVLAFDPERNWLLMKDGGERLRPHVQSGGDTGLYVALAELAGSLQFDLTTRVDELLALGVRDLRGSAIGSAYVSLLSAANADTAGEHDGMTEAEHAHLLELAPRIANIASELEALGMPDTLQHDDLHAGNALIHRGTITLFDWGDCVVSQPLLTLLVLLRGAANDLQVPSDAQILRDMRDAFVRPWDLSLTDAELDRACLLADTLACISRALTWQLISPLLFGDYRARFRFAAVEWLRELIEVEALTR